MREDSPRGGGPGGGATQSWDGFVFDAPCGGSYVGGSTYPVLYAVLSAFVYILVQRITYLGVEAGMNSFDTRHCSYVGVDRN